MFEFLAAIFLLIIFGILGFAVKAIPVALCLIICPLPLVISGIVEIHKAKNGYVLSDRKNGRDKILLGVCLFMFEILIGIVIIDMFGDSLPDPWPHIKEVMNTTISEMNKSESGGNKVTTKKTVSSVPTTTDITKTSVDSASAREQLTMQKSDYESNECYVFLAEKFPGEITVWGRPQDFYFITLSNTDFMGLKIPFDQVYYCDGSDFKNASVLLSTPDQTFSDKDLEKIWKKLCKKFGEPTGANYYTVSDWEYPEGKIIYAVLEETGPQILIISTDLEWAYNILNN